MGAGVSPRRACPTSVLRRPRVVAFSWVGPTTLLPLTVRDISWMGHECSVSNGPLLGNTGPFVLVLLLPPAPPRVSLLHPFLRKRRLSASLGKCPAVGRSGERSAAGSW